MRKSYSTFPLELKSLDDERGSFTGIAAVFGTVDQGGDIIAPGAFKEIEKTDDGSIRILNQHNMAQPVGKGRLLETPAGLTIKGQLNLAVQAARDVYELLKDGIVKGLSIGYSVLPNGAQLKENARHLTRLKLWEVSLVTFAMHPGAQVTSVKAACTDIRAFETLLRSQTQPMNLSARQAKKLLAGGWNAYLQRDEPDEPVNQFLRKIETMNDLLKETRNA